MSETATSACASCGTPVKWLRIYNGALRPFAPEVRPGGTENVTRAERWFFVRGRGLVPSSVLNDPELDARDYLVVHHCVDFQTLFSKDQEARMSQHETINKPGPRPPDLPLDQYHEYTYRWPTSWAHIVGDYRYVALCGDRMPEGRRELPHERERMKRLPVCTTCYSRFESRRGRPRSQHRAS